MGPSFARLGRSYVGRVVSAIEWLPQMRKTNALLDLICIEAS